MSSANILDTVWDSYLTTIDCLKVASRSIEKGELDLNVIQLIGDRIYG